MKRAGPLDTLIAVIAALACAIVALGLADTPREPISTAPPVELPTGIPRDAEVTVVAEDAEGRPLAGVMIVAFWRHGDEFFWAGKRRTTRDGTAHFAGLPRGVFWLIAETAGHRRTSTELTLSDAPREARVRLGPASLLNVRITDEAGAAVEQATVLVEDIDPLPHGGLTSAQGDVRFERLGPPPWNVRVSAQGFATERRELAEDATITLRRLGGMSVHVVSADGAPAPGATVVISGARLWPARKTTADAAGIATITGLLSGAYDLSATRGNQVSQTLFGFPLAEGRHDEVTLMLGPGRTIRVSVVDGEEVDAAPVADADVVLVEGGLGSFPFRGRTDARGEVSLGPLPLGPAAVSARASGFVARSGVQVPPDVDKVRVGLLRGGTLTGTVVDADGYPIVGASIEVIGSDVFGLPVAESPFLMNFNRVHFNWGLSGPVALVPAGELGVMPGPVPPIPGAAVFALPDAPGVRTATEAVDPWVTRGNGEFSAFPVTPGRLRALVRHPDFVETLSNEVTLAPGGRAHVRVELFRGGTLEGRVKDHRDFPVAGASVELRALKGTYERFAISAHDGSFAFAAVPKQVVVSVARPEEPGRTLLREHLEVTEGKRTEMVLVLPEPRESVSIRVTGPQDEPVALAQVTVACLDPSVPRRETSFTGDDGRVTLPDLGGLPLELSVEAMGFAPTRLQVSSAPPEVKVALAPGVMLSGRVTGVRGRFPVVSAQVTLIVAGQRHMTLTGEAGQFSFEHVPVGEARVTVEYAEYASVSLPIRVAETGRSDRPQELEAIDLAAPGSASGVVVDAGGAPVAGARVAVGFVPAYLPAGALPAGVATSDASGKFVLAGLAPGAVELGAYQPDVGRGSVTVSVDSDRETRDIVLRLDQRAESGPSNGQGNLALTLGEQGAAVRLAVVVVSVAAGSEAERSGVAPGDQLISVDGQPAQDMVEARSLLSGPVGSHVVVDVLRAGKRLTLTIAREQVRR